MRRVQIKLIVLLLAAGSYAQSQHHHHEQQPSKPSELLEGLGNHIHPIATDSALAQKVFDQGLALIFGFNHEEAARLFEREEKAWRAIAKAKELATIAPENERAYVEALVTRYSKDPREDRHKVAVAYKDAMKEVKECYPDDLDA